jgi:coproporphyrinogen III oxidase
MPAIADYDATRRGATNISTWSSTASEPRGIGGIFYDYLWSVAISEADLAFTRSRRRGAFLDDLPAHRAGNLANALDGGRAPGAAFRRGRYVEFNLLYDRGTHVRPEDRRQRRFDPVLDAADGGVAVT